MSTKEAIHTDQAPRAVGPYSQAVRVGELLFTAGQIALDPASGQLRGDDVGEQARQVLTNLRAVLEAGGSSLDQVIKTTVFVTTMAHYKRVNEVYAEFFTDTFPARSAVAVSELPLGALVEIECVALVG